MPTFLRAFMAGFACLLLPMCPGIAAPVLHPSSTSALPTLDQAVERVQAARVQAYEATLAEYASAAGAIPSDPAVAVAQCNFIVQFTDEDQGWVERAPNDLERCVQRLHARWPTDPRVRLFDLEQMYAGEAVEQGEQWLDEAKVWPVELRRELFATLSYAYGNDDKVRSGDFAVLAAELGDADLVARAVERLAKRGESDRALKLLRQATATTRAWSAMQRIDAALQLPDRSAALAELHRYDDAAFTIPTTTLARACLRAGDVACARKALADAEGASEELRSLRFDAAIAASDMPAAADAIAITNWEGFAEVLQHFALVLSKAPAMLFHPNLMLVAAAMLVLIVIFSLVPALLLVPVHYRGLVRHRRGKPALALFDRVGLRHAWWAGAVILCVPLMLALLIAPDALPTLLGNENLPPRGALVSLTFFSSIAGLLLLLPISRLIGLHGIVGDRAVWRSWWRVILAWAIVMAVSYALVRANGDADTSTLQTKMVQSLMEGGRARFGLPMTVMLIALLVPVYEELVFRGMLLGGMTRHISFGWANIFQAILFALAHDDSPRFGVYLTLGLLCGWLVKKYRSLGPSIALHGANNAFATIVRMSAGG
jgi:membrane protease YdiL (CAAX protease family)